MSTRSLNTTTKPADRDNASLLSPVAYDDDAASIHSRSDQDTDSDDDQLQRRARNSRELRAADRRVLVEEEETDKLVTDNRERQARERGESGLRIANSFGKLLGRRPSQARSSSSNGSSVTLVSDKRKNRRERRKAKKERLLANAVRGEDGELMYEMEEGSMKDGSSTGESSERGDSDDELLNKGNVGNTAKPKTKRSFNLRRWHCVGMGVVALFILLALVGWKFSHGHGQPTSPIKVQQLVSNGTALFAPTTIIISLDGFRADFLNRGLTPRLNAFIKEGVSPKYMLPSFPSVTFPNHYTLVTGLYPESHGVVGNTFWDPDLKEEFYYTDPKRSLDPKWWMGEPFWVTAERQGIRTAIHMWPGSEAHIGGIEPSFVDKYNGNEPLPKKVDRIFEFLDKPGMEVKNAEVKNMRPQIIAAYVPNVDTDGHLYGPNSTEIRSTIKSADDMLDQFFKGLEQRNLTDIVNVIVVSDHGMATTDVTRLIQLEDLVDMNKISHTDGWPLVGLRLKNEEDLPLVNAELMQKVFNMPQVKVYLRDASMPKRYHFSNNKRIAPLWIIPETGWAIVKKEEMVVEDAIAKGQVYHPRGLHGYDHEHPLMRAIFVARGPAFPHPPNSQIDVFQNIEVYNILCDSIGMTPKPNNGTLRLPLSPVGLHEPGTMPEEPADPVPPYPPVDPVPPTDPVPPQPPSVPANPATTATIGIDPVISQAPPPPAAGEPSSQEQENETEQAEAKIKGFWDWISGEIERIWGKITGSASSSNQSSAQSSSQ